MLKTVAAGLVALLAPVLSTAEVKAQTAPAAVAFDANTPVEVLAADPAARAILKEDVPMLLSHPSYETIKSLSLRQIQPYSGGALTDAMIETADRRLKALKAK